MWTYGEDPTSPPARSRTAPIHAGFRAPCGIGAGARGSDPYGPARNRTGVRDRSDRRRRHSRQPELSEVIPTCDRPLAGPCAGPGTRSEQAGIHSYNDPHSGLFRPRSRKGEAMPKYNNAFRSPEHREETIVDGKGSVIGTIRVKPSGVLWKSTNARKFHSV
jgi:hypothetical protein